MPPNLELASSAGGEEPPSSHAGSAAEAGKGLQIVQYFSNHAPCGAECKLCHRSDWTPNPQKYQVEKQPYLPWRRRFGQECAICPYAIASSDDYKNKDKAEIVEENKDPEKHGTYMEKCVKPYEDKKNETNRKRLPISNSSKTETRTTASTYSKLEYKNVIGVMWPMPVYKELMKKDPPKRQIQTHLINDQRVRGVLREPKHGCPPGCYEVTSLFRFQC